MGFYPGTRPYNVQRGRRSSTRKNEDLASLIMGIGGLLQGGVQGFNNYNRVKSEKATTGAMKQFAERNQIPLGDNPDDITNPDHLATMMQVGFDYDQGQARNYSQNLAQEAALRKARDAQQEAVADQGLGALAMKITETADLDGLRDNVMNNPMYKNKHFRTGADKMMNEYAGQYGDSYGDKNARFNAAKNFVEVILPARRQSYIDDIPKMEANLAFETATKQLKELQALGLSTKEFKERKDKILAKLDAAESGPTEGQKEMKAIRSDQYEMDGMAQMRAANIMADEGRKPRMRRKVQVALEKMQEAPSAESFERLKEAISNQGDEVFEQGFADYLRGKGYTSENLTEEQLVRIAQVMLQLEKASPQAEIGTRQASGPSRAAIWDSITK